jgi:hypothetical protein
MRRIGLKRKKQPSIFTAEITKDNMKVVPIYCPHCEKLIELERFILTEMFNPKDKEHTLEIELEVDLKE